MFYAKGRGRDLGSGELLGSPVQPFEVKLGSDSAVLSLRCWLGLRVTLLLTLTASNRLGRVTVLYVLDQRLRVTLLLTLTASNLLRRVTGLYVLGQR